MLCKCCTQYASKFGKLSSGHRTGKGQFSFQSQKMAMPKNFQTTTQLHSSHMLVNNAQNSPSQASTVCEPRTSKCTSWIQKRQKNQRSNCQHPLDHSKIKRIPDKTSTSALLTMLEPLTVWITINCGKFLKRWEYQITLPAFWETCMQVKKQVRTGHGTTDWLKIGKGVCQDYIATQLI